MKPYMIHLQHTYDKSDQTPRYEDLHLNANHIESVSTIKRTEISSICKITMVSGESFFVSQSMDEVMKTLDD